MHLFFMISPKPMLEPKSCVVLQDAICEMVIRNIMFAVVCLRNVETEGDQEAEEPPQQEENQPSPRRLDSLHK